LRKDFAGLRSKVLAIVRSQMRAKGISLDPPDLEACYAQALESIVNNARCASSDGMTW
jgi:hypothetical protein